MMSNLRGMAICIGVTGVASILLWFYFKNRIETVENKLNSVFSMIQTFNDQAPTVSYDDVKEMIQETNDPFENKELQYENEMVSEQLPLENNENNDNNENIKLINVSEEESGDSEEESGDSEEESEEEVVKK